MREIEVGAKVKAQVKEVLLWKVVAPPRVMTIEIIQNEESEAFCLLGILLRVGNRTSGNVPIVQILPAYGLSLLAFACGQLS